MEDTRHYMLDICQKEKTLSFEKIFDVAENRIHAIFLFLNMLELIQQKYLAIITGEGRNNFIIEYNDNCEEDMGEPLAYGDLTSFN
jgi:segregation and condensation protein A